MPVQASKAKYSIMNEGTARVSVLYHGKKYTLTIKQNDGKVVVSINDGAKTHHIWLLA